MNKARKSLILLAAAVLVTATAAFSPADAACLDKRKMLQVISAGQALQISQVLAANGIPGQAIVGAPRLCEQGRGLVWVVPLKWPPGQSNTVTFRAADGTML
ncbi:MAG TPA: hypothetical protein VIL84_08245 [Devosiaceae bacterium]